MKTRCWKITLENGIGTYSVEVDDHSGTLGNTLENLVRPVLLAAGFNVEEVNKFVSGDSTANNKEKPTTVWIP